MNPETNTVTNDEPDDIAGDVRAAIGELNAASPDPKLDVVIDKSELGRQRGEDGKFVSQPKEAKRETLSLKDKQPAPKSPPASEGVQVDPAQQIPDPDAIPPKPVVEPPKGWNADAKAKWSELPEWAQREATRREEALTKQLFAHDESRDFGRRLQEIANPYMPIIRAEGVDINKAFENYLQTAYALRTGSPMQKSLALHAIAQQFNVDLSLPHQQGGVDPRYVQLERQIQDLTQRLQGQDQERQQREHAQLEQQVLDFASQPGHEHFERVRVKMGSLLESGEAQDMDDAYDQACWAHPEIRASLTAAGQKAAQDQRTAELKAKADAAKSAAVSVKGAPGGSRPLNGSGSSGSIADDLRAAIAEVRGRV